MGTVQVQNVTRQFGGQVVLDRLSLELRSGETVGLIGPNGAGKTTLFRLIAGDLPPDLGTVTRSRGMDVGYLPQEPDVSDAATLHDEVAGAFAELHALENKLHALSEEMARRHDEPELAGLMAEYDRVRARFETAGGYAFEQRRDEVLGGLGFSPREYDLPMAVMSGGQKCRAALAKMLLQDRSFLLLDEPTNHLDIDAIRWLEKFLAGHHGGAVVVSHDRYLLDRITDRVVELDRGRVTSYPGNYSNYVRVKGVRALTQQRQFAKDQEFLAKERAFIAKHLAGQRTREAQGRRKRLERRLEAGEFVLERPAARRALRLSFDEQATEGDFALRCEGLSKRYGDLTLFADLRLQVESGQRLGITGPNGTGKSTLLKVLLGRLEADEGTYQLHRKASIGYYAQEPAALDPETVLLEHLRAARPELSVHEARSMLARFMFSGDDVFKRLGQLSGGEQSRVRLMSLILQSPNILVLDEPTNHLDIGAREALEGALDDYPGTIVVVSHDRYFLDRVAQQLLLMRDGEATLYRGNYSYYIEQVEGRRAAPSAAPRPAPAGRRSDRGKKSRPTRASASPERKRLQRLPVAELESTIAQLESRIEQLNARFGDAALYRDGDAVTALREELDTLKSELALAEEVWIDRADGGS